MDINIFKDYPNVIKQPMDFATIKAKVDSGAYKGPQHFFDDVKLVFSNARQFNPPGSDVNLMANGVEVPRCLLSPCCTYVSLGASPDSLYLVLPRMSTTCCLIAMNQEFFSSASGAADIIWTGSQYLPCLCICSAYYMLCCSNPQ